MAHELRGRVWRLGDHIETGQILPHSSLSDLDALEPAEWLFRELEPQLGARLRAGDFLWAGEGFGQGSAREDAARLLKKAGIRLVLAASFARAFYRNAINIGLPVAIGEAGETRDGDELQVNLVTGEVHNLTREEELRVEPVPREIRPILAEGGLIEYVRARGSLRDEPTA